MDMKRSLMNAGYLNADVSYTTKNRRKPKTKLSFNLQPGKMFIVDTIRITVQDGELERIINENSGQTLLVRGMNPGACAKTDEYIAAHLGLARKYGYYRFNRDYISFVADTVKGSDKVGLNMIVAAESVDDDGTVHPHRRYTISSVDYYLSDKNGNTPGSDMPARIDTCESFRLIYPGKDSRPALRPRIIDIHSQEQGPERHRSFMTRCSQRLHAWI